MPYVDVTASPKVGRAWGSGQGADAALSLIKDPWSMITEKIFTDQSSLINDYWFMSIDQWLSLITNYLSMIIDQSLLIN